MKNNEIFQTLLHLTGLSKNEPLLLGIFQRGGASASSSKVRAWRATEDNRRYSPMPDDSLKAFFNGLFEYRNEQKLSGIQVFQFPVHQKGATDD